MEIKVFLKNLIVFPLFTGEITNVSTWSLDVGETSQMCCYGSETDVFSYASSSTLYSCQ